MLAPRVLLLLSFCFNNYIFIFLLQFREIIFVDEVTGQKAFFTYKLSRAIVAATNYGKQFPSRWQGNGVADTNYTSSLSAIQISTLASSYPVMHTAIKYACPGAVTNSLPTSGQRLPTQTMPESLLTSMVIPLKNPA